VLVPKAFGAGFPLVRLSGSWELRHAALTMKYRFAIRLTPANEIRRRATRALLVLKSLGIICVIGFASAATAQNRYQITRIPTPSGANSAALGINNRGEVVGYSFQGEDYQAFLYSSSDQSMTDVGSLGGKLNAACAINDSGQVTGYSQDGNGNLLAFIFSRNQPIASLGTLEGASTSEAFGINHSGAVVGDSQSGQQNHRPALFSNGSVQDLGLGGSNEPDALETAYAVNDSGQIVGRHSAGNNAFHAFLYANGNTTEFATLGGANGEALAINKKGQVVGDSDTADGPAHAFLFDHSQLKDLGTLPGFDNASYARGINNSGDIVGESDSADQKRAFVYTKGQLVELDQVATNLSDAGFSSLDVAYSINDQGLIVGYGTTTDNLTAAFVAVPEGRGNRPQAGGVPLPQGHRQAVTQPQGQQVSQSNEEDYDLFYTRLSSDEGNWVEAGDYGYCYRPRVSGDWRPYRDGHWVWTDRGWYWDSNERFAWATYHYGRWVQIGGTGWCWVPGHQWAPAWVSWRESDQHVGWAPLPPEADVSVNVGISSWSDSYYDIGPAAYSFISYSHWHEPSYAQYIEPPQRNVQIITETKNVTNIVNNNNVINNFGPPVQTVAAKTNQNIQQVKLALNPATDPNAHYGQTLQGNQLNVVAPPPVLKPAAVQTPAVQNRIANPVVEKGWQGVKPQDAEKLKQTIAQQNPVPKDLPKATPFVKAQIAQKAGSPGATGSPSAVAGQKQTPPNLVKPGTGSGQKPATANATPGGSPNASAAGKKPVPPNLLGVKPSGPSGASPAGKPGSTPGASPMVKSSGTPGASPTPAGGKPTTPTTPEPKQSPAGAVPGTSPNVQKSVPPNLNAPRPSPTPGLPRSEENKSAASPTQKPIGNLPPGQNTPHASATPRTVATPTPENKPQTTPHAGPANQEAPKPTPTPRRESTNQEAPKPATTQHHEPANLATPKSTPEVKATPREVSTPKPEVKSTPPPKQEIKTPPPQVQHTPAPQPQVQHTPPPQQPEQPQGHKPEAGGKEGAGHGKPTPTP
jgi:probable HAF family extracellular repeat protein